MKRITLILAALSLSLQAQDFSAFKFRSVGPATTSGRVSDMAVDPNNHDVWYIATASGGVWKTANHGLTFSPIFDQHGSYSIGCVTIDPSNSNTIWVGTGENNNQRSVAYGDGLYKSTDGGASFAKVGLENSEHIGMIAVHPTNSDIVWVAAYGPLWNSGGDRGIYKTTDGGAHWERVLHVSEHTGFNEIHLDPRNPDVLYATAHQRVRHVFAYLSGGPESGIYKSTDGGVTWNELKSGIPGGDKGRLALAISPVNPDRLYLMIEGHGTYRSDDRGASFSKTSGHNTSGNYYVELFASPHDADVVYSMDTYAHWSEDGGNTFKRLGERGKHVDNHACWIDPNNPQHLILGCDGGIYETWDHAAHWHYKPNLPITQFYRVTADNSEPFYFIYGGTQDNFSLGGPSRTINDQGIVNSDWFVTQTGDGFESQIDPEDPNIIYAQAQYGWLRRFDRRTGEGVPIKPIEREGEAAFRFNWDAPLLISPHDAKTLYFAANVVFKSTDRGNTWDRISGDLSQQIDRNTLPLMGKVWGVDAIAKNRSTSIYGNIVSLSESPLVKGLLYVGTDDGLVHVTDNDGETWKTYKKFPGVPANTYVQDLKASLHDANTVYAVFNNHKQGDFKPYVMVSTNRGKTWKAIEGDLPERGSVYSLAEDHVKPGMLFAGTEFGLHVTLNQGDSWHDLSAGLPTIAVRDVELQRRENDVVLATFGRGFYVLDDYSPLRDFDASVAKAQVYDVKPGLLFHEAHPGGYGPPGFKGHSYYMADNPPIGATITYHIAEAPKSLKATRKAWEKDNEDKMTYPTHLEMRAEAREKDSYVIMQISDMQGNALRRINKPYSKGTQRVTWDGKTSRLDAPQYGARFVAEGDYQVQLIGYHQGAFDTLTAPKTFAVKHLNPEPAAVSESLRAFQDEINVANHRFDRFTMTYDRVKDQVGKLEKALKAMPNGSLKDLQALEALENQLLDIGIEIHGDQLKAKYEFETLPGLQSRLSTATWGCLYIQSEPTSTMREQLDIVMKRLPVLEAELKAIQDAVNEMAADMIDAGGPYLEGGLLPQMGGGE